MKIREYNPETDLGSVHTIWLECGWIDKGKEECFDVFVDTQNAWVAEVEGMVECFVSSMEGSVRYIGEDLPLALVSAVTTGRVARKQGLASRLTAHVLAKQALSGAAVSTLGIFDQGYYNNLGFGNGSYEHIVSFHPSSLKIDARPRIPRRLTKDDVDAVHKSRLDRFRGHGSCTLSGTNITRVEMLWAVNGFGLGYFDGADGELTHHIWFEARNVESGPYKILWIAYQNHEQFLELMGLIRGLGDQVKLVTFTEPQEIQLQDLLDKPFHARSLSRKSEFEQKFEAIAYWQMRILDLRRCMSGTHLDCRPFSFNLELSDPVQAYLDSDSGWSGISGSYVITLGQESEARQGSDNALPTLRASVNTFTRMWLGVSPASGLSVTDDLSAPGDLLDRLDRAFRLPRPSPGWDY